MSRPKTNKARVRRRQEKKKYYAATAYVYPKRRWTDYEISLILNKCDELGNVYTDRELSVLLKRSMKSICNKRSRLLGSEW